MYSVVKNGTEIGLTEKPQYIRLQQNGTYALCDEQNAHGINYGDTVYHVWGMPEINVEGIESVALVEFDAGARIREQEQTINALLGTTSEVITDAE
jgi:FMN-dependent NADH-azoreductase